MGHRTIITGRGGTGKSTFTALCVKASNSVPLVVDADPDQCLAHLLGVDLKMEGIKTVSEAMYDIQQGDTEKSLDSMPLAQKIDYLMQMSCLYETSDFDLLTLGVKWTRGCYCAPNNALRSLIAELASNYAQTFFDSPAGLEHINRKVVSYADDIFAIVDPSTKALRNVKRIETMAREIDFEYHKLYIVANYRFPTASLSRLDNVEGEAEFLGKIEADPLVEEYDWSGRSLMELPGDSPAFRSVKNIIEKTSCV